MYYCLCIIELDRRSVGLEPERLQLREFHNSRPPRNLASGRHGVQQVGSTYNNILLKNITSVDRNREKKNVKLQPRK